MARGGGGGAAAAAATAPRDRSTGGGGGGGAQHAAHRRPLPPGVQARTPEQEAAAAAAAAAVEQAKAALARAARAAAEGAVELLALAPPQPADPTLARALASVPPKARAAGAPPPSIAAAGAREVARVQPLRARQGPLERLDALPFYFMYALVCLALTHRALAGDWRGARHCWWALCAAAALHTLSLLLAHWLVPVAAALRFRPCALGPGATHVRVTPTKFHGKEEVVRLEARAWGGSGGGGGGGGGSNANAALALAADGGDGDLGFEFRQHRFVYDPERHAFGHLRYPDRAPFSHYGRARGFASAADSAAAAVRWGLNRVEVPLPSFGSLLRDQLLAPFFVFQVFCVGLWCLDEYIIYSLFTLGMLVVFECTVVFQRLRNLKELRALQTPKQRLFVFRQGAWDRLPGEALLPGDLVSIVRASASSSSSSSSAPSSNATASATAASSAAAAAAAEQVVVPADCLLLRGGCICEEAVLTGESTPQWKVSLAEAGLAREGSERLHVKAHKSHVLFGGTRVLQHSATGGAGAGGGSAAAGGEKTTTTTPATADGDAAAAAAAPASPAWPTTPDGGCLAVVLRTGFETAQGRLVRTILHSTERVTANSLETGVFILFLLCFAVLAAWHVLDKGLRDPSRDRFKLLLNCVMIVTSVIPPELPMELTIAVNTSLVNLARRSVFCTEPFRIPLAGRVDVACFDKTGTLTSDQMVLEGLAGVGLAQGAAGRAVARAAAAGGGQGQQGQGQQQRAGGSAGAAAARRRKGEAAAGAADNTGGAASSSPASPGDGGEQMLADPARVPASVAVVLAACQSLVSIDGEVVGDPLERASLAATRWAWRPPDGVSAPGGGGGGAKADVVARFHFSSALRRMSVVARVEGEAAPALGEEMEEEKEEEEEGDKATPAAAADAAADGEAASTPNPNPTTTTGSGGPRFAVLAKGAPEALRPLLRRVPDGYDDAHRRWAAEGARVIALARRDFPPGAMTAPLARRLERAQAEARLDFVGFAVYTCPLKPESAPTCAQLAASGHQLVMITGDAPLTACHAAQHVSIATRPVLILQHREEGEEEGPRAGGEKTTATTTKGGKGKQARAKKGANAANAANSDDDGDSVSSGASGDPAGAVAVTRTAAAARQAALGSPAADADYEWVSPNAAAGAVGGSSSLAAAFSRRPFDRTWRSILRLASRYDLCLTGDALAHLEAIPLADLTAGGGGAGGASSAAALGANAANAANAGAADTPRSLAARVVPLVQVFARVSPEQKEAVLVALRGSGRTTLMVGDGTNDVGGLKAAHVGVALLAPSEKALALALERQREARERVLASGRPISPMNVAMAMAQLDAERQQKQQAQRAREQQQRGGGSAGGGGGNNANNANANPALKRPGTAMLEELHRQGRPVPPALQRMADWLDKAEADAAAAGGAGGPGGAFGAPTDDDPPLIKPGDASMAAPFTAKSGGVAPVAEVLKQGRCTLVTTVQMFKILGLLCLSTAYTLSALYLAGVKLSDTQATLGGVLQAGMFFFLSSAKPLERLSLERPHPSIFCAYFFLSLLGQAAAQLAFVVFAFGLAEKAMPPEERQKPDGDFSPNLVNSACYLAEQAVQLTTFGVNYVGRPHNTPLADNAGMRKALTYAGAFWLGLVSEAFPSLNEGFGLVPMPGGLRLRLALGAAAVAAGTFFWERALRALLPAKGPPAKGYMAHERELGLDDFGPTEDEFEGGLAGGAEAAVRETKKRR